MDSSPDFIRVPESGYPALEYLADLGSDKIQILSNLASEQKPSFDLATTSQRLAEPLAISEKRMWEIFRLLMVLNQIRAERKLGADEFVAAIDRAVHDQAKEEWKSSHGKKWKAIQAVLPQLFQPDNLFIITRKMHDLWLNRSALVQGVKVITDLRPVYSEDATRMQALVLTNTLIVEFYDDQVKETRSIHFSLDQDDLNSLHEEIERTERKNSTAAQTAEGWSVELLTFGG